MIPFDEDFIKQVMDFDKALEGDWFTELDKPKEYPSLLEKPQWKIHALQISMRVLFTVIEYQMKESNRIRSILEKLPDTDEFKVVKEDLNQIREEAISTLAPIKKLAESMESSKNKKVDYIG